MPTSKPPPPPASGSSVPTVLGMAALPDPRRDAPKPPLAEPDPSTEAAPPPPEDDAPVLPFGPPRSGARQWFDALLAGPRVRLYALGGAAAFVLLIFVGVIVRLIVGAGEASTSTPVPAATPSAIVATGSAPTATAVPPALPVTCTVSGDSRQVAPRGVVAAGVEVVAMGGSIDVGFASGPTQAVVATLDPSTLVASGNKKVDTTEPVKHVTPRADGPAIDVGARRTVGAFDLVSEPGALLWAPHGAAETRPLWKLEGAGPAEAIRGVATRDGLAIVYRHDGAIWVADAKGALEAGAAPVRVPGLGAQLGSPSLAVIDGTALVAFADRAEASQPWGIRSFVWHPGHGAGAVRALTPDGGPGGDAMSPGVAALPGGGFLLLWTEGPTSGQQVRAQVMSGDGDPSGHAITISTAGVRAGQGQAAVLADGRGVVAFLVEVGGGFEVRAASLLCK